jgi:hypothetical protein
MVLRRLAAASVELLVFGVSVLIAAPYIMILLWPFIAR